MKREYHEAIAMLCLVVGIAGGAGLCYTLKRTIKPTPVPEPPPPAVVLKADPVDLDLARGTEPSFQRGHVNLILPGFVPVEWLDMDEPTRLAWLQSQNVSKNRAKPLSRELLARLSKRLAEEMETQLSEHPDLLGLEVRYWDAKNAADLVPITPESNAVKRYRLVHGEAYWRGLGWSRWKYCGEIMRNWGQDFPDKKTKTPSSKAE